MEVTDLNLQPERLEKNLKPWGDVTSPKEHDPKKFRYLVHAINPMATSSMAMIGLTIQRDEPNAIDKSEGDQTINLFSKPEKLAERVSLSCSLVDQAHHGTWGQAGLIIEAPSENVCITNSSDAGTHVMSKRLLLDQARRSQKLTAEQLLNQTHPSSYNEVVTLANNENKKVALVGFFYKAAEDGLPLDEGLYNQMKVHSERLHLPIIPIVEPNRFAENKINRTDKAFSVHFGGKGYNLRSGEYDSFRAYDVQRDILFFPSPEEMELVFNYLEQNNMNNDDVNRIRKEYMEVDKKRQLPQVKYDDQKNITVITKNSGYGAEEAIIRIFYPGTKINRLEELKEMRKAMADPMRTRGSELFERNLLNSNEAEQIVQEAAANAPENEKEKIIQWWQSTKANLAKDWQRNQERSSRFSSSFLSERIKTIKPKSDSEKISIGKYDLKLDLGKFNTDYESSLKKLSNKSPSINSEPPDKEKPKS